MNLFPHQNDALDRTAEMNRVAYYYDLGLGKTYIGAEKLHRLGAKVNLVVCQKSKISDWVEHFVENYDMSVWDLTQKKGIDFFLNDINYGLECVGVINYELIWRRPELKDLKDITLMLDESSLVQNESTKRTRFIMSLKPQNVILLSGTPTDGKYERLYSQLKLLGWSITKKLFYDHYIVHHFDHRQGFPRLVVDGYKNVERLKEKLNDHGALFMKADEVLDLPDQIFIPVKIQPSKDYKTFQKHGLVKLSNGTELVGDTSLTQMLYERMLCSSYSSAKLDAYRELLESTSDRLIVFYNFNSELEELRRITEEYTTHISIVNGERNGLADYEKHEDSVTFVQYQAGAMGLNLQKANKIIYFSPPLSSSLYEQSKGRIRRIGQHRTCFYYNLTVTGSVEARIYKALDMRRDYTDALFKRGE